jgi:Cu/Ag efflux pump CusA
MLKGLIRTSLRFRQLVLVLAAMLLVAGVPLVQQVPLDVFPEFAPPLVEVQTEAPGLSTTEVEQLITTPLEHALNGVPWLATLRSKSVLGLSSVTLQFARGTDLMRARQLVQERTALVAESLPALASRPVLLAPLSSTSRLLKIGVTSAKHDQVELSTLARWTIRPRLMAIPGVANVAIWGQRDRELQVIVDPDALRANGVTLYDVLEATAMPLRRVPAGSSTRRISGSRSCSASASTTRRHSPTSSSTARPAPMCGSAPSLP